LCAFDEKVPLELGHCCNDGHRHPAGRTGQVDATKDKTVDPDASGRQSLDRGDHVDRVPAQTIQLGHHQHVVPFQSVEQFHEGRSLLDCATSRNFLRNQSVPLDPKTGRLNLPGLVLRGWSIVNTRQ
jgi:hypothetical protein